MLIFACIVAGLLAGCNSETRQGKSEKTKLLEKSVSPYTAGRLAISESGATTLRVYDLDSGNVVQTYPLAHAPSALYASPGRRYALAIQRVQDQIQLVDGGIWQEDHVDHLHDYRESSRLLSYQITGVRPTHYEIHDKLAAVFMDGLVASNAPAGAQLISDASILASRSEANLTLPLSMHGTAEPRGDFLLTTYRPANSAGTLPNQVELYRRQSNGYQFVQRFETPCPELHGSYSNTRYTAFGCSDGVLVVEQKGEQFSARKLANPTDMATGVRIGTIAGHKASNSFVGIASPGYLFDIDPVASQIRTIAWAGDRTQRGVHFDRQGTTLAVLDDLGNLHLLDAKTNWTKRAVLPVVSTMPLARPFPSITANLARDLLYVADPAGRQITVVDPLRAAVHSRVALNFAPMGLTWLGIPREAQ
ncbi:hypothetical protein [Chitinimonas sp. BJB300]|uniref:hypothetical protein n=1 Tax=Chitinimonas sp. BJB300 TaxID=1559339 RepID=UPI000C0E7C87|nr:hypothetical protein [Chitinimonas sp. BJB300]PHV13440.1 hypothetical protein CSQ89_00730 [Chitinimonas sp. BJB300]